MPGAAKRVFRAATRLARDYEIGSSVSMASFFDKNTRKPLEGVVVAASWILLPHFLETTVPVRTLHVAEAVTDHMGQYSLPGFWPKFSLTGYLRDDQPVIRFFKDGYEPLVVANNSVYHPGIRG
jgi:hypothetical protein